MLSYDDTQGSRYLVMLNNGLDEGHFEARTFKDRKAFKPPDARVWCTEAGDLPDFVNARLAQKEHVYIGIAARQQNKGDKAGLLYSHFLWAELDFKIGGEAAARERLAAYPLPPTMIVHSGGGLHLYFRIERFDLTTEANRTLFERALKQLCADIGGDRAATDCTRILRIPGTWNVKAEYGEPRPVVLEHLNQEAVYHFADFALLPEPVKRKATAASKPFSLNTFSPDDKAVMDVINISAKVGKIGRLLAGDTSDHRGDHSAADQALCCHLAFYCGQNGQEQVLRMWQCSNLWRDKGNEKHSSDGRSYAQMTVDSAYALCTQFYDWNRSAGKPMFEAARVETVETDAADVPAEDAGGIEADGEGEQEPPTTRKPDIVAEAKAFVAELWEQLAADPGAAYSQDALKHFALLRSLPGEWARLKPQFKAHKVLIGDLQEALHAYNKQRTAQEAAALPDGGAGVRSLLEKPQEKPLHTSGDVLFNPPDKALLIPPGYKVMENGIQDSEGETVSFAPVLVVCRKQDIEGQTESLDVSWQRPQGWKTKNAPRSVLLNSQQIISLADYGFPVSSDTARALVKYIHEFEAVNLNSDTLPMQAVSSKLGWQGKDGEQGFLLGEQYITPNGEPWEADNPESPALVFQGKDDGEKQLAAAYTFKGSFERWQQVTAKLHGYPHVQMALLASFIPAILHIVDAANLVVDFSNKTSTGKTTSLRVAASVWGCPDTRQPDSIIHTWSMTRVWGERAAAILNGIPLFLDDTKQAKKPSDVGQFIYDLASGSAKGRGSVKGTQAITRWRTVLLSTGEAPATSFDESGGSRTRTISVTRAPFGKDTEETAKFVRALNREVCEHFGHAGIRFVQWLLQQRSQWPDFARQYRDFIKAFDAGSGATSRMAEHLALFQIVGHLLQQSGILSGQVVGLSPELTRAIMQEAEEASGELRALRHVISWAHAHASQFAGREAIDGRGDKKEPPVWAGRWDAPEESDLCFLPHILDNVLQEGKFDKTAIVRGWREKGWLDCGLDKIRNTKQVRMNNSKPHCVVIRYEAIFEAEGETESYRHDADIESEMPPQDTPATAPQTASIAPQTNGSASDGLTDTLREMVSKAQTDSAFPLPNERVLLLQESPVRIETYDLNMYIRRVAGDYARARSESNEPDAQEALHRLQLCEQFINADEEGFKG